MLKMFQFHLFQELRNVFYRKDKNNKSSVPLSVRLCILELHIQLIKKHKTIHSGEENNDTDEDIHDYENLFILPATLKKPCDSSMDFGYVSPSPESSKSSTMLPTQERPLGR